MPVSEHQSTSAHVFEELYRKHVPSVFRVALTCVNRRDLAEDLTSETFLALYRNLDQIDASRLPHWLFTVVRNRARDHWRRRMVEQRYLETVAEPVSADPPFERLVLESRDLRPVHRTCLMMRYVYGMTRREIAAKMGLSETQVKGYLQYALELLRKTYATPRDG
jgi:RNA polymerase sigma-70 factor (ECF subfamily)